MLASCRASRGEIATIGRLDFHSDFLLGRNQAQRDNFFAIDGHVAGSFDSDADLIPVDLYDRNHDAVADHDFLVDFAAQDKHEILRDEIDGTMVILSVSTPVGSFSSLTVANEVFFVSINCADLADFAVEKT